MQVKNIVIVFGFLVVAFIADRIWNKRDKRNFGVFYNASINGRIIDIGPSSGIVYFTLDNSDVQYGFAPRAFDYNHYMSFSDSAKVGDVIVKPAKSDTLRLIKGTHTYLFTFKKY
ncbi:hypothetical protein [Chitinophaga sp.]|uniref:hypothetical protein n=1 Tax=Chitinophaga sp. TaxID=1869181 RepID=UPI0031DCE0CE